MSTFWSALGGFVAWLRSFIPPSSRSTSVSQPLGPMPAGTPSAPVANTPANASVAPSPGTTLKKGQVSAGVGLTQVDGQLAVGARVDARTGDTLVSSVATVSGVVTKDSTIVAGALAARVGEDGALRAEGLYRKGVDGVHANLQAAYQDPTTEAGLRYAQENETRAAGAYLNKSLPHSSLSLGADYLWSPQGDGGRAYGRWQSDAIGETVSGFKVKGALEAGAVKQPGQDWSTYAAGRVTAEKENAALFAEVHHQAGPGVSQPDTSLKFGAQFRF